jgi:phosphopantothenoylcysteine decarboxylase/phosphopantothenate--cysteine ligase
VRFIGNRSSGKMGFALAAAAARSGARTVLVAGPVAVETPPGVERIDVATALEMEQAVHAHAPSADLIVMAAAVADYRPSRSEPRKIKKEEGGLAAIALTENPDILAGLKRVAPEAVIVGFAAETDDLVGNALGKLERKRADFLVANDVSRSDIAFESDANEVTVFCRQREPVFYSRRPKADLAAALIDLFTEALLERQPRQQPRQNIGAAR